MNSKKMRIAIIEKGLTNRSVARTLGISEQAFYNKMSGRSEFRGSEIKKIALELDLGPEALDEIFFDSCVN